MISWGVSAGVAGASGVKLEVVIVATASAVVTARVLGLMSVVSAIKLDVLVGVGPAFAESGVSSCDEGTGAAVALTATAVDSLLGESARSSANLFAISVSVYKAALRGCPVLNGIGVVVSFSTVISLVGESAASSSANVFAIFVAGDKADLDDGAVLDGIGVVASFSTGITPVAGESSSICDNSRAAKAGDVVMILGISIAMGEVVDLIDS